MRAARAAASIVRHAGGALAEAFLVAAIVAAIALALSPVYAPARFALDSGTATAGNGHKGSAAYSTISLAGSTAVRATQLARGSSVWFDTTVVGLKGTEYPMVYVECYSKEDGSLLYGQLDHPDAEFVLGGGSSLWWLLDPSPAAACIAHLYSYGGKTRGGHDVIRELTDPSRPPLTFDADG